MSEHTPGPWTLPTTRPPFSGSTIGWAKARKKSIFYICDCGECSKRPNEEKSANTTLIALAPTAPHECSDPTCSGDINRRRLELVGELVGALKYATERLAYTTKPWELSDTHYEYWKHLLAKAEALGKKPKDE